MSNDNLLFMKWCMLPSIVVFAFIIWVSFMQEYIKRKFREWKQKRNPRPPMFTTAFPDDDPEAALESIRNSLVVKKFEVDYDETDATMGLSDASLSNSQSLDSPRDMSQTLDSHRDLEGNDSKERNGFKEESITESISGESTSPLEPRANESIREGSTPPVVPARSFRKLLRNSVSSISQALEGPPAPAPPKVTSKEVPFCKLCDRPFKNGDDICESSNERCNHIFHKHCITSWLPYQNTCPCCSETFVVINA